MIRKIDNLIYQGDLASAKNSEFKALGISTVLNLQREIYPLDNNFNYLTVLVIPTYEQLKQGAEFCLNSLNQGKPVLVHCYTGQNRSCAFSSMLLALWIGRDWQEVVAELHEMFLKEGHNWMPDVRWNKVISESFNRLKEELAGLLNGDKEEVTVIPELEPLPVEEIKEVVGEKIPELKVEPAERKVLMCCDPQQDFLSEMIYEGLCKILSYQNVVTIPYVKSWHAKIDDWYVLPDGKRGHTCPPSQVKAQPDNEWSFDEICERINEFEFILLSSARQYALEALDKLKAKLDRLPPLIFMEGEDSEGIRWDIIKKYKPVLSFKRELTKPTEGILPLPFSGLTENSPKVDDTKKELDVFMLFGFTHPLRKRLVEFLTRFNEDRSNKYKFLVGTNTEWFDSNTEKMIKSPLLSYQEYMTKIAKAKIAFSVRGHGRDALRSWEIPQYKTCMFYCDPGIVNPFPWEDSKTCVGFKDDLSDLEEKLEYYLKHDKERRKIAKAGHRFFLAHHSSSARVRWMLEKIREKI